MSPPDIGVRFLRRIRRSAKRADGLVIKRRMKTPHSIENTSMLMLQSSCTAHKWARVFLTAAMVCLNLVACASAPTTPTAEALTPVPATLFIDEDDFCPAPTGWFEYIVRGGDTLTSIAVRANSTRSEIAAANCLNNPRQIGVGTRLYVPQRITSPD